MNIMKVEMKHELSGKIFEVKPLRLNNPMCDTYNRMSVNSLIHIWVD